jgi:hypothetical protein
METNSKLEALPGAIGVTHLKVYDSLASDGLAGGSPHMHFACFRSLPGHQRTRVGADPF